MKKFLFVVLALIMIFAVIGCEDTPAKEDEGGSLYIGYIMGGPELWQQSQMEAAKYACEKLGFKFVNLNSDYTPEKELSNAEDLIALGVDAIIMFTVNAETGQQVAQMCNEEDIPLFLLDGSAAEGPGKPVTTVAFDFKDIGMAVGRYVSEAHPGEKMIYITGLPGAGIVEAYSEGLHEALSAGVEVTAEQPADWDRAKAMSVAENIISSGTEFTVAFVNNEDMAAGVIQVLEENGLMDQVFVVSTGGSDDGLRMVQEGKIEATMAASPAYEACIAVKAVVDYFDGKDVPEKIISPVVVITKDNVSEAVSWAVDDNIMRLAGLMD